MRVHAATALLCAISAAISATEHNYDKKNDAVVRGASHAGDGQHRLETRADTIDTIEEVTKLLEHKAHQRFAHYEETEHLTSGNPAAQSYKSLVRALNITLMKNSGALKKMMDVVEKPRAGHVCYASLGCFHPGNRMALEIGGPASPRELGTKFRFYKDRRSRGVDAELLLRAMPIGINQWDLGEQPLVVIIHGFMQHVGVPWVTNLKNALLDEVNANVVTVNWRNGAKFPNYRAAAANTALVGAQLSLLLQEILRSSLLRASHVHLVGFSLGAHVAGFCGRHFRNITGHSLGRITGLDPAGPLFEGTNVSLSRADADFVDVIHTNAGPIRELKFGIQEHLGHVDFYPNGGSKQPKCADDILDLTCSHLRATELFTESITNHNCSFEAVACKHGWDGYRRCLLDRRHLEMAAMGYHCTRKVMRDP